MAIGIGRIIKRYCIVTLLPAFVASTIYLDYSHTQQYKAKRKIDSQKQNGDLLLHS